MDVIWYSGEVGTEC